MKQPWARLRMLTEQYGIPVYDHAQLDSTNEECRRRIAAGERQCLVLAQRQTGGKGRSGRSFFSPEGGLYMSLMLPMDGTDTLLTCRAAVAAAEAITAVTGISCGIKWVNDLYLKGKKVCGILAETVDDAVILGIGINLLPCAVPAALRDTVGFLDCGDVREQLAEELTWRLLHPAADFMETYRRRSVVLGKQLRCRCGDRVFDARALAIDAEGGLVVETAAGQETLRFGEVSIRGDF